MKLLTIFLTVLVFTPFLNSQNNASIYDIENEENNMEKVIPEFGAETLEPANMNGSIWVNDSIIGLVPNSGDDWIPEDLYVVKTRDYRGNNTSGIKTKINWEILEWENLYIDTTTFYSNGAQKSYLKLNWNKDKEDFVDTAYYNTIDVSGNIILVISKSNSVGYKHLNTYDDNNNEILRKRMSWNEDNGIWENSYIRTTEYNENGIIKERIYKYWDNNANTYVNKYRYENLIEDNKIFQTTISKWDVETGTWVNDDLHLYAYDSAGKIVEKSYKNWDSQSNNWNYSNKYVFTYSPKQKLISWEELLWIDSTWIDLYKRTFKYQNNKYLIEHNYLSWDFNALDWNTSSKEIIKYDSYYNKIEKIQFDQNHNSGELEKSHKTIYTWSEFETSATYDHETNHISIFPNPSSDYFVINGMDNIKIKELSIYSYNGIFTKKLTENTNRIIDIRSLTKGVYFVNIKWKGGNITTKLIKN